MSKKKYTKPFLEIEDMKLNTFIALSFGDGTTDTMDSKSSYYDYEEEDNE